MKMRKIFLKFLKKCKEKIDLEMRVEDAGKTAPINAYRGKTREEFWGKEKIKMEKKT